MSPSTAQHDGSGRSPRWFWLVVLLPPLWSAPGRVAADTKSYLSLDPGRLLAQAPRLWDAQTGLGTVTHQTIGYLFPQGPWWWVAGAFGVPDWLTQRLWWSALVASALFGMHRLARRLEMSPGAATIAALAYGFSPYLFVYVSRISAILLPWAVLPWMIIALRSALVDERRWRWPARFGLLVLIAGTVNATSIAFAVVGAVVWMVAEAGSWRRSWPVLWRSAVASASVSVWWMAALVVQAGEGIEILRFTETYATIRSTAMPSELLRGFGYWFSYGGDWMDPWVGATYGLLGSPWYLGVGLALVAASLFGLPMLGRMARRPAAVMVLVGLALAVGEAWTGRWTPWGAGFGALVDAGPGLVLRSTQRAVPVLTVGLALGLGAFATSRPRIVGLSRRSVVIAALAVQALPWWTGGIATAAITRGSVPDHWSDVATTIGDDVDHRLWETPGADFASYRWGGTIDPVLIGLTDRPVVARELIPLGTDHAADLVSEIERRIAENTLDAAAVAVLARLMAVDTVVARNDLEFERYALARPDDVTERLDAAPGLRRTFTGPATTHDEFLIDEQTYGGTPGIGSVPVVAVWSVDRPAPVLSVRTGAPVVLHGSGATLVALAEQGLIDGTEVILDGDSISEASPAGAWTVLGDSNRSEDRRWYSIGATLGATRSVGETSIDPTLQSLEVVEPGRETVSVLTGGASRVTATSYGSPAVLSAEDRPEHALDGDPFTAWRGAALEGTAGLAWAAELASTSAPTWVDLLQPVTGERARWITRVRLVTEGPMGEWESVVELGEASRTVPGQRVPLSGHPIDRIRIEVLADSTGALPGYGSSPGVGFAEVTLEGVTPTREWIVIAPDPRREDEPGRTTVVLDRRRLDPSTANRFDPEPMLARRFTLSGASEFTVRGAWAPSAHHVDHVDHVDPVIRASSDALIGVTEAVWISDFDPVEPWFEIDVDRSAADHLEMVVARGSIYSSVGEVTIRDASGGVLSATPAADGRVHFDLSGLTGQRMRVELGKIGARTTVDRFAERSRVLPVGVVDLGPVLSTTGTADPTCRSGLLTVDGRDVPVRLLGSGTVEACGVLRLSAGQHEILSEPGHRSGIDIDRLVLDDGTDPAPTAVTLLPMSRTDTSVTTSIDARPGDWIVFAESAAAGWRASVDGVDLGPPVVVNGYGMAWEADRPLAGTLRIRWTPQRSVDIGLLLGSIGTLAVGFAALGIADRRRQTKVSPSETGQGPIRRRSAFALLALTVGPAAVVASSVARWFEPRRRWVLVTPFVAMWAWTSARQLRWNIPIDLRWPASMGWAQWLVVAVVAGSCWKALTDE